MISHILTSTEEEEEEEGYQQENSRTPWNFDPLLEKGHGILLELWIVAELLQDGPELKIRWVLCGLSTRIADVALDGNRDTVVQTMEEEEKEEEDEEEKEEEEEEKEKEEVKEKEEEEEEEYTSVYSLSAMSMACFGPRCRR